MLRDCSTGLPVLEFASDLFPGHWIPEIVEGFLDNPIYVCVIEKLMVERVERVEVGGGEKERWVERGVERKFSRGAGHSYMSPGGNMGSGYKSITLTRTRARTKIRAHHVFYSEEYRK